jgi:hypothetical protein
MLCLEMHSNVMLRFMVQALQDPLLCSSTDLWLVEAGNEHVFQMNTVHGDIQEQIRFKSLEMHGLHHVQRHMDRRLSTTACPGCCMGYGD